MNKPDHWIKFNTEHGPIYIDLEEVHSIVSGSNPLLGTIMEVHLSGGRSFTLNSSFFANMTRIMDAWMTWKNKQ
jgi:hypothetical protein